MGKFVKNCVPWEEPHAEAAKESKDEEIAETTWAELTATPIPSPLASLGGKCRENREWLDPGKKEGVSEGV